MATLLLSISTARPSSYYNTYFETAGGNRQIAQRIANFLERVISGNEGALSTTVPPTIAVSVQDQMAQATGRITFSAATQAADTILINGVTFTCVSSGATGTQWNAGTSASACAVNFVSAVNSATASLVSGYVTVATAFTGASSVIVTSSFYGTAGNQTTIAKGVDASGVITVSGARLTAGSGDPYALSMGF